MSYKIAIASSTEEYVDETFGQAKRFWIYEVTDGSYKKIGERIMESDVAKPQPVSSSGCCDAGCGNGGCSKGEQVITKVENLLDCRCIVCKKIGFQIQKQLERKAIVAFDVNCSVKEALDKITYYFSRLDQHQSLRK